MQQNTKINKRIHLYKLSFLCHKQVKFERITFFIYAHCKIIFLVSVVLRFNSVVAIVNFKTEFQENSLESYGFNEKQLL